MTYTLRSVDELVARIERAKDPFGFERDALTRFLDWDAASRYVNDSEQRWAEIHVPYTVDAVRAHAVDYLEYATGRVLAHRLAESARAAIRLDAWCWVLGADRLAHRPEQHPGYMSAPAIAASAMFLVEHFPPRRYRLSFDGPSQPLTITERERMKRLVKGEKCMLGCELCA